MGEERPPPPITLTDPGHPGPLHDVLGDDAEPWRPTRKQLLGLLLVLAVVAAVVVPYERIAQHRAQQRRVIAAANVALLDASDGDRGRTVRPPAFTLSNASAERMELVSAKLDGYPTLALDQTVAPKSIATITVPLPAQCPSVLPEARPAVMVVTYRVRGHLKTTSLDVHRTAAAYAFRSALQSRCLLFLLQDAVEGQLIDVRRTSRGLAMRAELQNVSPTETTLTRFEYVQGFAVRAPVPARLAGSRRFDDPATLALDIEITVTSCPAARAFVRRYADDLAFEPALTAVLLDGRTDFYVELKAMGTPLLEETEALVGRSCR